MVGPEQYLLFGIGTGRRGDAGRRRERGALAADMEMKR